MAVSRGHSDGTERLGASEEEDSSSSHRAELFTCGSIDVSELLSYCHSFFIWMLWQLTHPHISDRCTAQLKSMLFRSDSVQHKKRGPKCEDACYETVGGICRMYVSKYWDCCCTCDAFVIIFKFIPWLSLHYAHK